MIKQQTIPHVITLFFDKYTLMVHICIMSYISINSLWPNCKTAANAGTATKKSSTFYRVCKNRDNDMWKSKSFTIQKRSTTLLQIASPNAEWFSKFFHHKDISKFVKKNLSHHSWNVSLRPAVKYPAPFPDAQWPMVPGFCTAMYILHTV